MEKETENLEDRIQNMFNEKSYFEDNNKDIEDLIEANNKIENEISHCIENNLPIALKFTDNEE